MGHLYTVTLEVECWLVEGTLQEDAGGTWRNKDAHERSEQPSLAAAFTPKQVFSIPNNGFFFFKLNIKESL